ncbi:MAG: hypothetical protein A2Y10_05655 [Planctomycetes bacterium GWF2_41_51]|nr:MAG: hypothetical protein A2Y10_05655 [Planctomycetes bacterium GWF2_41_51]
MKKAETNTPITLKQIALKVGVSNIAVGHVLLGSGKKTVRVSEKTAERIRQVAAEMNYRPNLIARQLAGKGSNIIGVVIDTCAPEIHFKLLSEMERLAGLKNYRFMVGQTHNDISKINQYREDFASRGVDGIICMAHQDPDRGHEVFAAYSSFKNVVFIGKPLLDNNDSYYVSSDYREGMSKAVDHLCTQKCKRIGLLLLSTRTKAMEFRLEGFELGLKNHGFEKKHDLVEYIGLPGQISIKSLEPYILRLVHDHSVDGILACNDMIAAMAVRILQTNGLKVPEQVRVIGYDNVDWAGLFNPGITTLDQNYMQMSKLAIELLWAQINNQKIERKQRCVMVPPTLVVRQSA